MRIPHAHSYRVTHTHLSTIYTGQIYTRPYVHRMTESLSLIFIIRALSPSYTQQRWCDAREQARECSTFGKILHKHRTFRKSKFAHSTNTKKKQQKEFSRTASA